MELAAYKMAYDAHGRMPSTVYLYNIYLAAPVDTLQKRIARAPATRKTGPTRLILEEAYLHKLAERHDAFAGLSARTSACTSTWSTGSTPRRALAVAQKAEFALSRMVREARAGGGGGAALKRAREEQAELAQSPQ